MADCGVWHQEQAEESASSTKWVGVRQPDQFINARYGVVASTLRREISLPPTAVMASHLPSGEKASEATQCGERTVRLMVPAARSQKTILTGLLTVTTSKPPVTRARPSGEIASAAMV